MMNLDDVKANDQQTSRTMRLSEIVSGDVEPSQVQSMQRQARYSEPSRRSFIKGAGVAITGVGLAALGVFPAAKEARADGYKIWLDTSTGPCGPDGDSRFGCSPGCGPSQVCSHCCTSSGWHRTDGHHSLRPNVCYSGGFDGWNWKCGTHAIYRCHDGWDGSTKTICRKTVSGPV